MSFRRHEVAGAKAAIALASLALLLGFVGSGWGSPSGPNPAQTTEGIRWSSSFDLALEQARAEQKFVMVDFFTGWCGWCKVLDRTTYVDSTVVALSQRLVNVKVDAEAEKQLARTYRVNAYPTILFLNPDGTVRQGLRGYQKPEQFAPLIDRVLETRSEIFALSGQVRENPTDGGLRRSFADALARSGNPGEAASQLDTLLTLKDLPDTERSAAELDRLAWRVRAGQSGKQIRKGLEEWIKSYKEDPRRAEARYFLARAESLEGRSKDAKKHFEQLAKENPGSWFAQAARDALADLGG